jgi:glutaredoxin-like YruB-family protein
MMDVTVYTTPACPYCYQTKEFLSRRGVAFTEKNVAADPLALQEMFWASGQRGVPVTVIDGQAVVGYDQRRLTALLDQGTSRKVTLGISIADAARIAEKQGSGPTVGAYIGRVKAGSPAEKAGLRAGDVITELGRRPIRTAADVHAVTAAHRPGDRLSLTLERGGREMRVIVRI